jgi:hypothetical protein
MITNHCTKNIHNDVIIKEPFLYCSCRWVLIDVDDTSFFKLGLFNSVISKIVDIGLFSMFLPIGHSSINERSAVKV